MSQSRRWCFTLNNPTDAHIAALSAGNESIKYLVFGKEVAPTTGTPHLQGFVIFETPKRLAWIRRNIVEAHFEICRGTSQQAADYCKKDGDYEEFGELPQSQGKRTDIENVIQWLRDFIEDNNRAPSQRELAHHQARAFLLYGKRLTELARQLAPDPIIREGDPNEWQEGLVQAVEQEPDDRSVIFYVDPTGGKGKTWIQQYLVSKFPERVQILGVGKRDDLAHAINPNKSIFLFNVPRGGMEYLQYTILEQLKDRMVFSPKYESQMKTLATNPHVVVFCNEDPDMTKMSDDRYAVTQL